MQPSTRSARFRRHSQKSASAPPLPLSRRACPAHAGPSAGHPRPAAASPGGTRRPAAVLRRGGGAVPLLLVGAEPLLERVVQRQVDGREWHDADERGAQPLEERPAALGTHGALHAVEDARVHPRRCDGHARLGHLEGQDA